MTVQKLVAGKTRDMPSLLNQARSEGFREVSRAQYDDLIEVCMERDDTPWETAKAAVADAGVFSEDQVSALHEMIDALEQAVS